VNQLDKLNGFMKQGGQPVGFVFYANGDLTVMAFGEYADDKQVQQYLTSYAAAVVATLEASGLVKGSSTN
jgi:hypothetical protein